jgi:hypothetical protein
LNDSGRLSAESPTIARALQNELLSRTPFRPPSATCVPSIQNRAGDPFSLKAVLLQTWEHAGA